MAEEPHAGIHGRVLLRVDERGRLQIPASLRKAAGIEEGGSVLLWLEQGRSQLMGTEAAAREAQRLARHWIPAGDSLADELIADRREEASREDADE